MKMWTLSSRVPLEIQMWLYTRILASRRLWIDRSRAASRYRRSCLWKYKQGWKVRASPLKRHYLSVSEVSTRHLLNWTPVQDRSGHLHLIGNASTWFHATRQCPPFASSDPCKRKALHILFIGKSKWRSSSMELGSPKKIESANFRFNFFLKKS